ncbi:DUF1127 domain-containing protein [Pseudohoeflea coraliihabitans]|uniref:DUF1127 domain-containing protein n=1 Tax=Pseudohoeflea coraliihabitans TaxID=2860393 RepID=A0ABS6WTF7_9HYPH|nr:DUF1127 domain-containing protein [Pseudohoeflea sp. DP4N28-3]MBW3098340.1 DUF1127 domain-containing protein [Pseudohoeflea sp. DP4N28-3]
MARTLFRRWQRRRMITALQELDDHLLRDIGIERHDIPRLVASFSDRELGMRPVAADVEREHQPQDESAVQSGFSV